MDSELQAVSSNSESSDDEGSLLEEEIEIDGCKEIILVPKSQVGSLEARYQL